ncbi:MAG TPA: septal ring lytic transglycosylase RlpA family protein [Candidatus Competibacteraceae bacterium]|nr:septal ring lytic transglycosylase RlpA family protein [Candidatus Competibacteraceae bacterium]
MTPPITGERRAAALGSVLLLLTTVATPALAAKPAQPAKPPASHIAKSSAKLGKHPSADAHRASRKPLQVGTASYYSQRFEGRRTASGERFSVHGLTAAHATLALHSRVRVTNLRNGKSVVVRINDRGISPRSGRIMDLSPAAARELDMLRQGVAKVAIEPVDELDPRTTLASRR